MTTAVPASASGSVRTSDGAAGVDFASYGEHFTVHDYKADGYATSGYLARWTGSSWYYYPEVVNRNGYAGDPVSVNYSIAEGTQVAYMACVLYPGGGEACTQWHNDTA
ncbi:hypothetical protein ACU639_05225 [Streptomyces cynarae]|uniref:hypothetical protein n=1 Tax=Streptomyces cynarae TaxID=2981134 RepID=UPI00406C87BA